MTVDATTGVVSWTPTAATPDLAAVVLQVYDAAGAHDTQTFAINVAGGNHAPVFDALPAEVPGQEGEPLEIPVERSRPRRRPARLLGRPPAAGRRLRRDTARPGLDPGAGAAGTYQDVTFAVSDGLVTVRQTVNVVIAPALPPPSLLAPPDVNVREGDAHPGSTPGQRPGRPPAHVLQRPAAAWCSARPQHRGLHLDAGLHAARPHHHSVHRQQRPGQRPRSNLYVTVLNVNAAPVFANAGGFQTHEGQQLVIRAQAFDPDNPAYLPPDRAADGTLLEAEAGPAPMTYTASGLPPGATFDPVTQTFTWTPGFDTAGTFQVTFTATDDGDGTGIPRSADQDRHDHRPERQPRAAARRSSPTRRSTAAPRSTCRSRRPTRTATRSPSPSPACPASPRSSTTATARGLFHFAPGSATAATTPSRSAPPTTATATARRVPLRPAQLRPDGHTRPTSRRTRAPSATRWPSSGSRCSSRSRPATSTRSR